MDVDLGGVPVELVAPEPSALPVVGGAAYSPDADANGANGLAALYIVILVFVAANLTVGITLSSLAQNQLQAMQLTFFFFLPSILLSGFMFPFRGMPAWAQAVGHVVPMTYFNRLARGILLKGNRFPDLWPDLWPLLAFTVVVMTIAVRTYRRTLD